MEVETMFLSFYRMRLGESVSFVCYDIKFIINEVMI